MPYKRNWDVTCPRIWDSWEQSGYNWVIQDLEPEDDEAAIQILIDHFIPDETMFRVCIPINDEESVINAVKYWRTQLALRTSLGCYVVVDGTKTLVGLNMCVVTTLDEKLEDDKEKTGSDEKLQQPVNFTVTKSQKDIIEGIKYLEAKCDPYKYLNVDKVLYTFGLVVKKEYRGLQLGSRILTAREPLCALLGVKGTSTIFTGAASQKSATRAGFTTIAEASLKELAEQGLNYPEDEDTILKLMVKKYGE